MLKSLAMGAGNVFPHRQSNSSALLGAAAAPQAPCTCDAVGDDVGHPHLQVPGLPSCVLSGGSSPFLSPFSGSLLLVWAQLLAGHSKLDVCHHHTCHDGGQRCHLLCFEILKCTQVAILSVLTPKCSDSSQAQKGTGSSYYLSCPALRPPLPWLPREPQLSWLPQRGTKLVDKFRSDFLTQFPSWTSLIST